MIRWLMAIVVACYLATLVGLIILAKTGIWWPLVVFLLCVSVQVKYKGH